MRKVLVASSMLIAFTAGEPAFAQPAMPAPLPGAAPIPVTPAAPVPAPLPRPVTFSVPAPPPVDDPMLAPVPAP